MRECMRDYGIMMDICGPREPKCNKRFLEIVLKAMSTVYGVGESRIMSRSNKSA
jgi:hypothetical protein